MHTLRLPLVGLATSRSRKSFCTKNADTIIVSKSFAVTESLLNGGSAKKVLQHLLAVLFKVGPMGVLRRILTIDPEHVCNTEALLLSHSILGDLLACLVRKKVQSKGCAQPEQSWRIVILIIYCGLILLN